MKLSNIIIFCLSSQLNAIPTPDETGVLLNHNPGSGNPLSNLYMHTIGHFINDFPQYIGQLAKGDIMGTAKNLGEFVLYHNPINLAQDFTAGMMGGGNKGSTGGNSGGGHQH